MKNSVKMISLAAAILTAGCSTSSHWGYGGTGAPENWGNLSEDYKMCSLGQYQTPINIQDAVIANLPALDIHYGESYGSVVDNGHTIQVNLTSGDAYINLEGKRFNLKQFHFHGMSENQINGQYFPLEVHLVHANDEGKLAVIGVMYELGQSNTLISSITAVVSDQLNNPIELTAPINFEHLLPNGKGYYRFSGSLTTPPCSEGVSWIVMKDALSVTPEQKERMDALFKHANNRPIQELNGRVIVMSNN